MNISKKDLPLLFLRLSLGWLYTYAGLSKLFNPDWTSKGYLLQATTFSGFYHWLANSSLLRAIDIINEWSLLLLGLSLLTGLFIRLSASLGIVLMLLYYFPVLSFPYVGKTSFLIDEHLVYIAILIVLITTQGQGTDQKTNYESVVSKKPYT